MVSSITLHYTLYTLRISTTNPISNITLSITNSYFRFRDKQIVKRIHFFFVLQFVALRAGRCNTTQTWSASATRCKVIEPIEKIHRPPQVSGDAHTNRNYWRKSTFIIAGRRWRTASLYLDNKLFAGLRFRAFSVYYFTIKCIWINPHVYCIQTPIDDWWCMHSIQDTLIYTKVCSLFINKS